MRSQASGAERAPLLSQGRRWLGCRVASRLRCLREEAATPASPARLSCRPAPLPCRRPSPPSASAAVSAAPQAGREGSRSQRGHDRGAERAAAEQLAEGKPAGRGSLESGEVAGQPARLRPLQEAPWRAGELLEGLACWSLRQLAWLRRLPSSLPR